MGRPMDYLVEMDDGSFLKIAKPRGPCAGYVSVPKEWVGQVVRVMLVDEELLLPDDVAQEAESACS